LREIFEYIGFGGQKGREDEGVVLLCGKNGHLHLKKMNGVEAEVIIIDESLGM